MMSINYITCCPPSPNRFVHVLHCKPIGARNAGAGPLLLYAEGGGTNLFNAETGHYLHKNWRSERFGYCKCWNR
jgi:hypothetical protein